MPRFGSGRRLISNTSVTSSVHSFSSSTSTGRKLFARMRMSEFRTSRLKVRPRTKMDDIWEHGWGPQQEAPLKRHAHTLPAGLGLPP